jgi:hypothetical protein
LPYTSKAELERERWMTLAQAIAYVAEHDGCDCRSALEQLCDAICDRSVSSKWEDRKWFDWEAQRASFWARIRIRDAKVADPETGQWRTLLVLKDDVFRIWPEPSAATAGSESGKGGSITKAKGGAPSASAEIFQALDRLSRRGHPVKNMPRQRLAELVGKECGKELGKRRGWTEGTVLRHIQSYLEEH